MNARAQSQVLSSSSAFTAAPVNVLQRKCACGGTAGLSGECAECQKEKLVGQNPPLIQPKLKVSQPNDKYEQEADRVADEVMRMPEPRVQRQVGPEEEEPEDGMLQMKPLATQITPIIQRETSAEEEDEEDEIALQRHPHTDEDEEGLLQAKRACAQAPTVTSSVESAVQSVRQGGGQPLDQTTRAFFEPRFGHDFSQVHVHTGGRAAESARAVQARAYTVGEHVVFGAKQFAPSSTEGRRLLAHELTHVIQQSGADSAIVPEEDSETGDSTLQKHETIDADETVGVISRQAMPKLRSGLMLQRAACPCCADSISIGNINRIDNATHMGHSFDTNFGLSYPESGPQGSCTLEWWEKTNVPYTAGMRANTWTDMFQLLGGRSFDAWNNRQEICSTSQRVTDTDPPSLGKRPGRTVTRTLDFRIVINSMPPTSESGCSNASQQVTAKQVLTMVSGAPDWAASSFTTP